MQSNEVIEKSNPSAALILHSGHTTSTSLGELALRGILEYCEVQRFLFCYVCFVFAGEKD